MRTMLEFLRRVVPRRGAAADEDNAFAVLAEGLSEVIARHGGTRQARRALPHTLALARSLRDHLRRGRIAPAAGLLLESMHESWRYADARTQVAFKACLREVIGQTRH